MFVVLFDNTRYFLIKSFAYKLLILTAIYLIILFRWGYEFGRNDQMQALGYAKYLNNPSLYQHDLYIQGLAGNFPNERFLFSYLMSFFFDHLEGACIVLHFLFSLLMLWGLYLIFSLFIENELMRWLALLVLFVPMYGINLGGNELYYNTFFVSNVVKTVGLWGIWFILSGRYYPAFMLFSFAVFLQPVVGAQLFVTFSAILFFGLVTGRISLSWKKFTGLNLLFFCTAAVWMLLLRRNFEGDHSVDDRLFFNILFVFRSPHHYLPSSFPLKSYLILMPLFAFATIYFYKKNILIFLFFCVSFFGLIVCVSGVHIFHSNTIAALQWFKITIWLKAFCIMALFAAVDKLVHFYKTPLYNRLFIAGLFSLAILCTVATNFFPQKIPFQVYRDFGQQYQNDAAVDIALKAKKYVPANAVFVHPMRFTELKYYGERSSFVEYKIMSHTKKEILHWHERLTKLYHTGWGFSKTGDDVAELSDRYFYSMNETQFLSLAGEGVTHVITNHSHKLNFPLVAENTSFKIYRVSVMAF